MKLFSIRSVQNNAVIFEGRFASFSACVEQAVADNIPLPGADLRRANLANAALDDAVMPGADLTGANLSGTNLSESRLNGVNFTGAALYNTCLAWSDLRNCNFEDADFGGVDISGCDISGSRFSTLSSFKLDFIQTRRMNGCTFKRHDGDITVMTRPPIVISGLATAPVVLTDNHILSGHKKIDGRAVIAMLKSHLTIECRRKAE